MDDYSHGFYLQLKYKNLDEERIFSAKSRAS